jgi:hypothetical protein
MLGELKSKSAKLGREAAIRLLKRNLPKKIPPRYSHWRINSCCCAIFLVVSHYCHCADSLVHLDVCRHITACCCMSSCP